MTPDKIARLKTVEECRGLMVNAKRLDNAEVHRLAFQRLCELSGEEEDTPLERDFAQALAACEELLSDKNGRKSRASKTRLKLKNKGLHQCLTDWSTGPETTDGLKILSDQDLGHLSGEYLVVKYADEFDAKVVKAAKTKLKKFGVDEPDPEAAVEADIEDDADDTAEA
jgi:hypothetical protein